MHPHSSHATGEQAIRSTSSGAGLVAWSLRTAASASSLPSSAAVGRRRRLSNMRRSTRRPRVRLAQAVRPRASYHGQQALPPAASPRVLPSLGEIAVSCRAARPAAPQRSPLATNSAGICRSRLPSSRRYRQPSRQLIAVHAWPPAPGQQAQRPCVRSRATAPPGRRPFSNHAIVAAIPARWRPPASMSRRGSSLETRSMTAAPRLRDRRRAAPPAGGSPAGNGTCSATVTISCRSCSPDPPRSR